MKKYFDLTWLAFPIKQQKTIKCAIYWQKMQKIFFLHKKTNLNNVSNQNCVFCIFVGKPNTYAEQTHSHLASTEPLFSFSFQNLLLAPNWHVHDSSLRPLLPVFYIFGWPDADCTCTTIIVVSEEKYIWLLFTV